MWTTNVSPAADAGTPSAAINIPEESIDTWPFGLRTSFQEKSEMRPKH